MPVPPELTRAGADVAQAGGAATIAGRPARSGAVRPDTRGPVPSLILLQAVKDEFDPEHRMAPGRLADAL